MATAGLPVLKTPLDKLYAMLNTNCGDGETAAELSPEAREVQRRLSMVDCHFTWSTEKGDTRLTHEMVIRKHLDAARSSRSQYNQGRFALSLAHRYGEIGKFDEALHQLKICEPLLNGRDRGIDHVVKGVAAHIYFNMKMLEVCRLPLAAILPYNSLSDKEKGSMIMLKCHFMGYLLNDKAACDNVLAMTKQVMELDPENRYAYGSFAKLVFEMNRLKITTEYTLQDAIDACRRDTALRGPAYRLGDMLMSVADLSNPDLMDGYHKEASQIYRNILLHHNNKGAMDFVRLGTSFGEMMQPYKDLQLATRCFMEALAMDPGNAYYHYKYAAFLYNCKDEILAAIQHLDKYITKDNKFFTGHMFRIMLKTEYEKEFDVEKALLSTLQIYTELMEKTTTYCYLGDYLQIYNHRKASYYYQLAQNTLPEFNTWAKTCKKFKFMLAPSGEVLKVYSKYKFPFRHNVLEAMGALEALHRAQCQLNANQNRLPPAGV